MLHLDAFGEKFAFRYGGDALIPVTIRKVEGEELYLSVIPRLKSVGKRFLDRFSDHPFSDAAIRWLWEQVEGRASEWGFVRNRYSTSHCRILRYRGDGAFDRSMLEKTVPLTEEDDERNDTLFDLAEEIEIGKLCYGVLEGGRVVSIAVSHVSPDVLSPGDPLEMGIETVPSARRRGYASACLCRMTKEILDRGLLPEFRCAYRNVASLRTALRVGYRQEGRVCYFLLRRKEN